MEIDWQQWQLAGYARDSQRILQRLQDDDSNGFLTTHALDLLHTYFTIPPDLPNKQRVDKHIVMLAQVLYVYVQSYGFWEDICMLWPRLLAIAKPLPDRTIYVQLVKQLAVVRNNRGEIKDAQVLYEGLINAATFKQLPPEQHADVYHQTGVCYLQQGKYLRAKQLLLACLAVHNIDNNCTNAPKNQQQGKSVSGLRVNPAIPPIWESRAYAFNQLGNLALVQGDFKVAQANYQQSLNILILHNETDNLACVAYQALGHLYVIQRRFSEAIPLLEKNLRIRQHREEKARSAYGAIYLASAYLGWRRIKEAESLLNQAMTTSSELQEQRSLTLCHLYFGYLEQQRGSRQNALAQWQQARIIANAISAQDIELQALTALFKGQLLARNLSELWATIIRVHANLRQQELGLVAAGRLLFYYLRW